MLTQWWAMAAPLEYVSRTHIDFQPLAYVQRVPPAAEVFIVSNDRWLNQGDEPFAHAVRACGSPVLEAVPLPVFR